MFQIEFCADQSMIDDESKLLNRAMPHKVVFDRTRGWSNKIPWRKLR